MTNTQIDRAVAKLDELIKKPAKMSDHSYVMFGELREILLAMKESEALKTENRLCKTCSKNTICKNGYYEGKYCISYVTVK